MAVNTNAGGVGINNVNGVSSTGLGKTPAGLPILNLSKVIQTHDNIGKIGKIRDFRVGFYVFT